MTIVCASVNVDSISYRNVDVDMVQIPQKKKKKKK